MSDFVLKRSGRRLSVVVTVAVIWLLLALAMVLLDASVWVIWLGALATLPALYDIVTGRVSSLVLSDTMMTWQSGKRTGSLPLSAIKTVRLDTRLDLSIKATLILHTGAKMRLPLDAVPPSAAFEEALKQRGILVERHHFRLVG
ncbi:hypothetical protein [Pseudosulfitobacter pseudonitzschiae]|uniref:Bacterial PH domain protein n=1 Tax=Pseudosulfitobacter pseudonitzschiae TaxID=1402135 RepID=A0A073J8N6_9RHOB|nr:hypothetical protein [Pseudosulfitobacter pseudonitzschiae]KEJ98041.1 hypothetical protein SUH3_03350 [Pseudosulfitobacter pseudonitzschiae]MBM1815448.1 hypothetical protein [Pseudosulfitobacter pseudonitzschiae]MBM1832439.1 hypothetical protein [Pseudosulfitobacter pseudonitzschiae]MBM1837307.1 hypothetical protein [Pseudosulfitobacter pseudonitzschiae]MBM1842153.1 hypothetical protein [Pseudosulfitobacter pseudonitzschiae]